MHGGHADDAMAHDDHGGKPAATVDEPQDLGHDHANTTETVSPIMTLYMTPPGAGDYTLFLEFIGGGNVHTVVVPLELA